MRICVVCCLLALSGVAVRADHGGTADADSSGHLHTPGIHAGFFHLYLRLTNRL